MKFKRVRMEFKRVRMKFKGVYLNDEPFIGVRGDVGLEKDRR
jgi:hypothetical protein